MEIDICQDLIMKMKQKEAQASFVLFSFLFENHLSVEHMGESHLYFKLEVLTICWAT